jgi:hypothetical protein
MSYAFKHKDPYFIALCLAAAFFFAVHIVLFVVNNPLAAVYYYALLGLVLATGKLAASQSSTSGVIVPRVNSRATSPQVQ